jgi:hypothetical protein
MASMADETPMSGEALEHLLLRVRNAANRNVVQIGDELLGERPAWRQREDQVTVWLAAEIGLTILNRGRYLPSKGAIADVRDMLAWYDSLEEG